VHGHFNPWSSEDRSDWAHGEQPAPATPDRPAEWPPSGPMYAARLPHTAVSSVAGRPEPAPARRGLRLPGPLGLAALIAVLLVTFGAGAALLSPSFAGGRDGSRDTAAQPVEDPYGAAADPSTSAPQEPAAAPTTATPERTAAPTRTAKPKPKRTTARPAPKPATGNTAREDRVTALVNQERAGAGCGRVRTDERLRRAARGHSRDMAARNYFSHDSLDGRSPWDRAEAAGYPQPIGENIAKGQRTPADVVRAWMNSPGHRRNILNCDAKAIGVGLAFDDGVPVWTQMFGAV
jgi:uncharacterized protein YkwD